MWMLTPRVIGKNAARHWKCGKTGKNKMSMATQSFKLETLIQDLRLLSSWESPLNSLCFSCLIFEGRLMLPAEPASQGCGQCQCPVWSRSSANACKADCKLQAAGLPRWQWWWRRPSRAGKEVPERTGTLGAWPCDNTSNFQGHWSSGDSALDCQRGFMRKAFPLHVPLDTCLLR